MKYVLLFFALFAFVFLPSLQAAPLKYTGTWVLSREKSEGLTGALAGAEILLLVSQDEKRIHVEQKVKVRDREQPSQELIWNLDGTETTAEVVRPMAGTMNLKARWIEASKALELQSSISGDDQGKEVTVTTKETWELLGDGKILKITRTRTSPQGRQTFKLYFEKQP